MSDSRCDVCLRDCPNGVACEECTDIDGFVAMATRELSERITFLEAENARLKEQLKALGETSGELSGCYARAHSANYEARSALLQAVDLLEWVQAGMPEGRHRRGPVPSLDDAITTVRRVLDGDQNRSALGVTP